MKTIDILSKLDACLDAQRWSGAYPDPVEAWAACTRPEWMLWLIARSQDNRAGLIELACDFAASAAQQLSIGQTRTVCESTISTVRAYLRRESTISTVRKARSVVLAHIEYAALVNADADAEYAADASCAALALANAAYAASASALVNADAAYAAYAAASSAASSSALNAEYAAAYAAADAAALAAAHAADASFAADAAARARQCSHIRERFTAKQLIAQLGVINENENQTNV